LIFFAEEIPTGIRSHSGKSKKNDGTRVQHLVLEDEGENALVMISPHILINMLAPFTSRYLRYISIQTVLRQNISSNGKMPYRTPFVPRKQEKLTDSILWVSSPRVSDWVSTANNCNTARFFEKWTEAHKTKLTLKAVA